MDKVKTYHELQFENEHVRVWKTVIAPNQPLETDKDAEGHVVIGLKGGELKQGDGKDVCFETHKAYWLTAKAHGTINLGKEPVEIMVIEMKGLQDSPLPSIPID